MVDDILATLRDPPARVPIPPELDASMRAQQLREFGLLIRAGWILLPVLFALGLASALYVPRLSPEAGPPPPHWLDCHALVAAVVVIGLGLSSYPRTRAHYATWLAVASAIVLGMKLHMSLLDASAEYRRYTNYDMFLTVVIVGLGMRLPLRSIAIAYGLSFVFALAFTAVRGLAIPWFPLLHYYGGAVLATTLMAALAERQDRLRFLQTVLIEHQAGEREELNARLESLVRTDPLTNLGNRRHFDESLASCLRRAARGGRTVAVLIFDVDHFKAFNDHYGHVEGDACLAELGAAIRRTFYRAEDVCARIGGEEFAAILSETDAAGAREVAERLIAAIDALRIPHAASVTSDHVTISVGCAVREVGRGLTPEVFVRAADDALYEAKRSGRHRLVMTS